MALVDELNRARDISGDVRMRAVQQRPLSQIAAENTWRDTAANTPRPGVQAAPETAAAAKPAASRLMSGLGGLAAGAGIGGAVQSIADNSTGYRDEFQDRTGVKGVAGDALRTLGAVGDTATFGLATRLGQGIASATNGGSFGEGFSAPTIRDQFASRQSQASAPSVSAAYPDETQRGAATSALSRLASVPETAAPNGQNFADWQKGASQMERDTAANAYQDAWKARTPSGMRGADANATALYNAEQATRGTGISAQRQKNGVMEFSGDGANALPQSYTQGVDLNLANERNARANAIRESMLDSQPGTRGVISDNGPRETNARFENSRNLEMLQRVGPQQAQALSRVIESNADRSYRNQSLMSADRKAEADRELDAQRIEQTGEYNRARLGIDKQQADTQANESGARALTAGLQGEASRAQLAEQQRIGKLRDTYMAETDPAKKEQIGRALLTLQGKEPDQTKFQVATNEDLIDPANPMLGTRKTAYVIDPRTGQGRPVVGGATGGSGQQAPSYEQYAAQIKARNPGADDKTISQEYMKRYGS